MYLPQFLAGMFFTSGIVALWTYTATGSVWSALSWTIVDLVVLQVGYFAFVIRLAYKRPRVDAQASSASPSRVPSVHRDGTLF